MFFEMKECHAGQNRAHFLQNKGVQNLKLSENVNSKSCFPNPIFFLENQLNF